MGWFERHWPFSARKELRLSRDAFSDGQIGSKLWLCEELERAFPGEAALRIDVLAGWCGLLPFLIFSRGRLAVSEIRLYDLDGKAVRASRRVNEHWRLQGKFRARVMDVNRRSEAELRETDLFINTSCEHFSDLAWWSSIPSGKWVALQGTDMKHREHVRPFESLEAFRDSFPPLSEIRYLGRKDFSYRSFSFSRYLLIGRKG